MRWRAMRRSSSLIDHPASEAERAVKVVHGHLDFELIWSWTAKVKTYNRGIIDCGLGSPRSRSKKRQGLPDAKT
jgi:hypothetical protein